MALGTANERATSAFQVQKAKFRNLGELTTLLTERCSAIARKFADAHILSTERTETMTWDGEGLDDERVVVQQGPQQTFMDLVSDGHLLKIREVLSDPWVGDVVNWTNPHEVSFLISLVSLWLAERLLQHQQTALTVAAASNQPAVVRLLIAEGVDIHATGEVSMLCSCPPIT